MHIETDNEETDQISPEEFARAIEEMKRGERLPLAVISGLISCLVGAGIWAAITVSTGYQIGWIAIGVGFLVGKSVLFGGKGVTNKFGIIGAVFAFLGCLLGNFFSIAYFISVEEQITFIQVLIYLDYTVLPEIMGSTFSPIDLLFYGLAIFEGYKFGFQDIDSIQIDQKLEQDAGGDATR